MVEKLKIIKAILPERTAKLYVEIIDYFDTHGNFTGWAHGFYPTDDTAREAVAAGTLYEAYLGDKLCGSVVLNSYQPELYRSIDFAVRADEDEVLCVHTLAVKPECRREGVAIELMQFAERVAREANCKCIRLDTTNINLPAIGLYKKCGFVERGTGILRADAPKFISFWYVFEKDLSAKQAD